MKKMIDRMADMEKRDRAFDLVITLLPVAYVVFAISFIVVKIAYPLSVSWWWVLSPVYAPIAVLLVFFMIAGAVITCTWNGGWR